MRLAGILLATSLLTAATAARAQDEQAVIVVTGKGLEATPATPAYSTVELDRDQITRSGSGRIEDVLSNVAGFQQFRRSDSRSSNPSAQGATLRALGGNATSRAQMLLDGVPLADPFFGYIPFSAISPDRLGSIRVTRGGGSGPFGAGALAGTIELESAGPAQLGTFSGSALISDRREAELSATLAPRIGDGFAEVSGRWDRGQGFYTTPESQRVPATVRARYNSWSASGRVVQPVAQDVELQVRAMAFDDARVLRFAGADNTSTGQDLSARIVSRGPWQVDALAYAQWRNFTSVVISSTSFRRTLDQKDTPSTGLGGKLEVRPPVGGGHTLRFGADYRRSEGNLAEDTYNAGLASNPLTAHRFAGGVNSDLGLYAEDDWELGALTLTGGVRADRWTIRDGYYRSVSAAGVVTQDSTYADRDGWEVSYRGGAVFKASDAVQLRAAAYSGLRLPTLNELYRPFAVFPVTTQANAALENERLEGFEGGVDLTPAQGVRLALTAFDNRVKNAVANVTIGTNLRQRQNVDSIHAQGVEASAGLDFGQVSLDGTLAYTEAEVRSSGSAAALNGLRPAQTPKWASSVTASWAPAAGTMFAATLRHVSAQFEADLPTDVLPAATTVDLFAKLPLVDRISLVARVENLFDTEVQTRNVGNTSIDLGAPLTVWAGFRYGF
ncbi:MAG: TonB-dependent receptor [Croceibacterium sp.]